MANDGAEGWKATRRRDPGKPALGPKAPAAQAKLVRTVRERAVAAIVAAEHGDPFGVLGPHEVAPGVWEVRAMLPEASAAAVTLDAGATIPMEKRHDAGFFVASFEATSRPNYRLSLEIGGRTVTREDAYRFGGCLTDEDIAALRDVGGDAVYRKLGAQTATLSGVAGFNFAVWAPNARRVSVIGDFNDWDGRRHPMRLRHAGGVWELFVPQIGPGTRYKFEIKGADRGLYLRADLSLAQRRVADAPGREGPAPRADLGLRVPPRLLDARRGQPLSHLSRARRKADSLRARHGLLAYRASADHRVSLRRLLGLPAGVAVRANEPLRQPGGVLLACRGRARGRHRPHPRLGAGPFPERPAWARAFRRHASLRARRPAPGLSPGLGHLHLQLRPPGGRGLPRRQRPLLARALPPRRPARRCRRVDALSRLLPPGRRVGAEPLRRQREPRRHRLPAAHERSRLPRGAGRDMWGHPGKKLLFMGGEFG